MKISIVFSYPPVPKSIIEKLESFGEVNTVYADKLSEEDIIEKIPETEILICGNGWVSKIGKRVFAWLKKLKFIAIYGVGYDWVDIEEANKSGIIISNTVGGNAESVAEHTWWMILNLSKRISELERKTRTTWANNVKDYQGMEVFRKTIGIIGLGEIGKRVARIAKWFDMRIIGTNRTGKEVDDIEIVDLSYLLRNSDIITLCIPLNSSTENIIGEQELELMKHNVILINSSREKLVNKNAVLETIAKKRLFGYGVETELLAPIPPTDDYFKHPNILVTPHNAWNTKESEENNFTIIMKNVEAFLDGDPINVVKI